MSFSSQSLGVRRTWLICIKANPHYPCQEGKSLTRRLAACEDLDLRLITQKTSRENRWGRTPAANSKGSHDTPHGLESINYCLAAGLLYKDSKAAFLCDSGTRTTDVPCSIFYWTLPHSSQSRTETTEPLGLQSHQTDESSAHQQNRGFNAAWQMHRCSLQQLNPDGIMDK